MFGTKRLAKRSIVGSKVSARWQDGRYYPGTIRSQYAEEGPLSEAIYTVSFDDGYEKNISAKFIVGPGFQSTNSVHLKNGQKVFITLNGREVTGQVVDHRPVDDEVLINVRLTGGEDVEISKRLEEVRLLKSRKSARLLDQDTDYSKLADLQLSESKRRTVSMGIDVPSKHIRHWQSENAEYEDQENTVQSHNGDVEMMDESIAAMVLTSLSCSPQSPKLQDLRELPVFNKQQTNDTQLSSSTSSSGFFSNQSERSDPSPPSSSHLSESAPAGTGRFGTFMEDEDLELEEDTVTEPFQHDSSTRKVKTMYQCTWPKCGKISSTCSSIEKHVRTVHLELMESDSDSEHEEEFYYTEIEVNVENVTQGFSDMCTSSPPTVITSEQSQPLPDHDYQKKDYRQMFASSVPSTSEFFNHGETTPIPISIPPVKRSLSWQNTYTFSSSPSSSPIRSSVKISPQERLQQHQAQSPKSHMLSSPPKMVGSHKKPRSEVRKCRKVYGMENRDMWCTQCKWKKACTRFLE